MSIPYKCKLCRRYGQKLLLNERCTSQKCALTRRGTKPGMHGKRTKPMTAYGKEFVEKQKLKFFYLLRERQLKNLFTRALRSKTKTDDQLFVLLERRLDNVVYRLGFLSSRTGARQAVSHGNFLLNGKKVNNPAIQVKIGDRVTLSPKSATSALFRTVKTRVKDYHSPAWLELDKETMTGKVVGDPAFSDTPLPISLRSVIELYGR